MQQLPPGDAVALEQALQAGRLRDGNPWKEVAYANAPKAKRVRPSQEDAVQALLAWLDGRHPDWQTPRLFIETKLVAGGRTLDLCKVRSDDLEGTTLTLTAQVSKTRAAREVPLPAELAAKLHRIKGPTWLWERTVAESKEHRPTTRTHAQTDHQPGTWRWTIQNIFREFNEKREKKDKVRPHDLRARAITLVAAASRSGDATAEALGVDPQTARHYLDSATAFKGTELLQKLAGVLLPQKPPEAAAG